MSLDLSTVLLIPWEFMTVDTLKMLEFDVMCQVSLFLPIGNCKVEVPIDHTFHLTKHNVVYT